MGNAGSDRLTIAGYHDMEVTVSPNTLYPVTIRMLSDRPTWETSLSWEDWDRLMSFVNWRRADTAKEHKRFEESLG